MTSLRRVLVGWTGVTGLPGLSVFYSLGSDDATASLGTFFNAVKPYLAPGVAISIPATGDTIESTTGILTGSWSGGSSAVINSTGTGTWAAGTGAYVRWVTNTVRAGRKFQGRTFLCPIKGGTYDSDGTMINADIAALQTAANALVTAGKCVVYGRPLTPGGSDGLFAGFTGATVPDRVTSLRSRRN